MIKMPFRFLLLFIALMLFAGCRENVIMLTDELCRDALVAETSPLYSPPPPSFDEGWLPQQVQKESSFRILTPKTANDIRFAIYSEGIFTIFNSNYGKNISQYGYVGSDGEEITGYVYDYAYPFSNGLACVRQDGKYGFIDTMGGIAIPLIYDNATPFVEGLAYFEKGAEYGFLHKNGTIAFLLDCDSVSSFQEGLAFFSIDGKYGYIDTAGNVAIDPIFDDADFFSDGVAKVRVGHGFGLIDSGGVFVAAPFYDDIAAEGKFFRIRSGDMTGFLNTDGTVILPPEYSNASILPDCNAIIIRSDDGAEIIGLDGIPLVPATYDDVYYDEEIRAIRVCADGKYGYLSSSDFSVTIPFIYDYISLFKGEFAEVTLDGEYAVIDRGGNLVMPFGANRKTVFPNGLFALPSHGKYFLTDRSGNHMNDTRFDQIVQSGDGFMVLIDNKYGFLDGTGKYLVRPIYDYCFSRVLGMPNCYIANSGYDVASHSIIVLEALKNADLSDMLLKNEITPRAKRFNQFLRDGFIEYESNEGDESFCGMDVAPLGGFIRFCKLYQLGDGAPILHCYIRPVLSEGFALSYSGFYSAEDDRLTALVTGYECGGSIGGDIVCFWQDNLTREVYIGTYYHFGGFGGNAYGGEVYRSEKGDAVPVVSFGRIDQFSPVYDDEGFHVDHSVATEYLVNGEDTTAEKYNEIMERYSMLIPWLWN